MSGKLDMADNIQVHLSLFNTQVKSLRVQDNAEGRQRPQVIYKLGVSPRSKIKPEFKVGLLDFA